MPHPRWFILMALLLMSCACPLFTSVMNAPSTGVLEVDIHYEDDFYVETFNYAREAENIRHFVLVVPEGQESGNGAGWVFTSLELQANSITVSDDRREYAWALDYLYEAPQGRFRGEFEPGTYLVAAAFIAGPLSREDAGVDDDVILWAGVTGGGASTDYQTVTIEAGETTSLNIEMTDANGWACPWLYVWNGETFERRTEILRNLRGAELEGAEITPLGSVTVVDGEIVIRIAEEKEEVTYLDALSLNIGGEMVQAEGSAADELAAADGSYLILRQGEARDVRFPVPASYAEGDSVSVVATGYYLPE